MADGTTGDRRLDQLLDRFTTEARDAVSLARAEARRLGHAHIGTEHLLLGILSEGSTGGARALADAGATLAGCREKAVELVGPAEAGSGSGSGGDFALSPRAVRALERAGRLAIRQRSERVETQHLLIAVMEVEGRAGQVLRGVSVDPAALARSLRNNGAPDATRHAEPSPTPDLVPVESPDSTPSSDPPPGQAHPSSPATAGLVAPRCATCGAELAAVIAHRVLVSRGEKDDARRFLVSFCSSCGTAIGAVRAT